MKTLEERIKAQCDNMQQRYIAACEIYGVESPLAREYWGRWDQFGKDLDTLCNLENKYPEL